MDTQNGETQEAAGRTLAEKLKAARESAGKVLADLNKALASHTEQAPNPEESESACPAADKSE